MLNLKKFKTYSIPQAMATIAYSLITIATIAVGITTQKYYFFGIEVILTTNIFNFAKIFYEGEGRFEVYWFYRRRESTYFEGNKAKIISLLLIFSLTFIYIMLAGLNRDIFQSLLLNNFLASLLGLCIFLPFLKYKDEAELMTIHSINNTYLSRQAAWLYRIILFILSLIIGVYISSVLTNLLISNQYLKSIIFLLFPIIWVIITARPINRLTKPE